MAEGFTIVFYTDRNGKCPITEFLDCCSDSLRSKILRQFLYLKEFGISNKIPNIKKVTGTTFWELRILGKDNIRIFCKTFGKRVCIFHIFSKKSQKTPMKELKLADKRLQELDI